MSRDKTLIDLGRRRLSVLDHKPVSNILPSYFAEEYPKFAKFIEAYYDYADSDVSPHKLIDELFLSRDITQTDIDLLSFIEDELLLGQQYFEGFTNKRAAAKYSNTLYKSKGTKYGIEQFFRTFFGISPEIVYPKENIFIVGNLHDIDAEKADTSSTYTPKILIQASEIGAESQKYLTDNKLYQKYAILIRAAIPIDQWREEYKLFVHPAGMYLGGEVQIVSVANNTLGIMPTSREDSDVGAIVEGIATNTLGASLDITGLIPTYGDSAEMIRTNLFQVDDKLTKTLAELDTQYDTFSEFIGTNSPTFDEDSEGLDGRVPRFSNVNDTMDEVAYSYYDSDSA